MQLFQTGPLRYQPAPRATRGFAQIDQRHLAFVVGLTAICLPGILGLAILLGQTCFRDSISHYYHAPFWNGPFIGALAFIGAYLCVYVGEDTQKAEARLTTVAGIAAFGIALFPVAGHGCDEIPSAARALVDVAVPPGGHDVALIPRIPVAAAFTLFAAIDVLHYACAVVLFGCMAWFALVVFTAVDPGQRMDNGRLRPSKRTRNWLYRAAGCVILAAMLAGAGVFALERWSDLDMGWWARGNWTFWMESASLWAFGLSWMVKGRFFGLALRD